MRKTGKKQLLAYATVLGLTSGIVLLMNNCNKKQVTPVNTSDQESGVFQVNSSMKPIVIGTGPLHVCKCYTLVQDEKGDYNCVPPYVDCAKITPEPCECLAVATISFGELSSLIGELLNNIHSKNIMVFLNNKVKREIIFPQLKNDEKTLDSLMHGRYYIRYFPEAGMISINKSSDSTIVYATLLP